MSDNESDKSDSNFEKVQLAWQFGSCVSLVQSDIVLKQGSKVRPSEEKAMLFVRKHAPEVPVPAIEGSSYRYKDGIVCYGELYMDFMSGKTLVSVWPKLVDLAKERICQAIWKLVARIRTLPRPEDLGLDCYRTVDGSPFRDPLLGGGDAEIAQGELDDNALRNIIYAQYVACNGLSYSDGAEVADLLPRSTTSVFTHGDINPRNIIVDEAGNITALLDWESSGWFPDYWEYAQMMKFCGPAEHDWQRCMERTKPEPWDITGIQKARRVLF